MCALMEQQHALRNTKSKYSYSYSVLFITYKE